MSLFEFPLPLIILLNKRRNKDDVKERQRK